MSAAPFAIVTISHRSPITDRIVGRSWQVVTVESSSLIAAIAGGNSTVGAGVNVVLDMTAVDPDEVLVQHTTPSISDRVRFKRGRIV